MAEPAHVLIVDDDPEIRALLTDCLAIQGYQLSYAEDGPQVLELLENETFDVVLLDLMLPEINGLEVLRRVEGRLPDTEIIVLTGYASMKTALEALRLGAYDFIPKPFPMDAVRSTVKRALEKQRLKSQLAAIYDLSRQMVLSPAVDKVAQVVLDIARRVLEFESCALWLVDKADSELYLLDALTLNPEQAPRFPLDSEKSIIALVAREGQAIFVPDVEKEPRYLVLGSNEGSELAVPLLVDQEVIGVLNVESRERDAFSGDDLRLLSTLASQAAVAIQNARLYEQAQQDITERSQAEEQIRRRTRELEVLNEIVQSLTSSLDLQETLTLITQHTTQLLNVAATSILLYDAGNDDLWFAAASGEEADFVLGKRLKMGQGVAGWVAQHGEPVLISDVSQDNRWFRGFDRESGFETRSILCVPLRSKGQIIGSISAINKENGTFHQEDVWLLSSLAAPAATAIENAQLFEQVRTGREQLQALSRRLVEIQEAERGHVARELHDETGQALSYLLLGLSLLEREGGDPAAVSERVHELEEMVDEMLENLHRLAMNLRPATLDYLGLVAAMDQYVETLNNQHTMTVQFQAAGIEGERLPAIMETALYRVVQEALTNVVRHAQASRADVLLERRDNRLIVVVEDDGRGFDPRAALESGRLGLFGMQERAEMLGGTMTIESAAGKGTTVVVEVPYDDSNSDRG